MRIVAFLGCSDTQRFIVCTIDCATNVVKHASRQDVATVCHGRQTRSPTAANAQISHTEFLDCISDVSEFPVYPEAKIGVLDESGRQTAQHLDCFVKVFGNREVNPRNAEPLDVTVRSVSYFGPRKSRLLAVVFSG